MRKVTLTREFSGFVNVPDNWIIGADDSKPGTIMDYLLPDGFSVGETRYGMPGIFGPDDYRCEIVTHSGGRPQVLSGDKSPVLAVVGENP